jgi:hypothetical protein
MKRRTEIMVEEEIRIIRKSAAAPRLRCTVCGGENWMMTPNDAALAVSISVRTIYRWVEEAKIHFRESAEGALVVCLGSIREQLVSP